MAILDQGIPNPLTRSLSAGEMLARGLNSTHSIYVSSALLYDDVTGNSGEASKNPFGLSDQKFCCHSRVEPSVIFKAIEAKEIFHSGKIKGAFLLMGSVGSCMGCQPFRY